MFPLNPALACKGKSPSPTPAKAVSPVLSNRRLLKQWVIIRVQFLSKVCIPGSSKWGSQTAAAAWPGNVFEMHMLQAPTQTCQVGNPGGQWEHAAVLRRTAAHDFDPQASLRPLHFAREEKGYREVWGLAPSFPDDQDEIKRKATCFWIWKLWLRVKAPSVLGNARHSQEQIRQMRGPVIHVHQPSCLRTLTTRKTSQRSSEPPSLVGILLENAVNPVLNSAEFSIRLFKKSTLSSIFHVFPFPRQQRFLKTATHCF